MSEDSMIVWDDNDPHSKARAFEEHSDSVGSYEGISRASHRDFLDLEPNRSVRPGFNSRDYYAFRQDEQVPRRAKRIIKMCMDAYDKVGIVRNVIDLMGDFGSQGISIVHENKSVEKFYQQWFKKCDGKERSERFLNQLYRTGHVIAYRSSAKITPKITKYLKSMASDIRVQVPSVSQNVIPWRYNFFNPLTLDMKNGDVNLFLGRKVYDITTNKFFDNFKDGAIPAKVLDTLPANIKNAVKSGAKKIPLDPERLCIHYYKKDDWQKWAHPLTYAILDDIVMLEKMRLADLSALDGAISNIRLWTVGSLDHKILPNRAAINKLRNILASNVGGGTMELVWGPELSYTESNSQVYKFLGSEKYTSVLNSIYAGLGVPPTLTGMATNGGGFTNNFISLKTLVERLQYGRDQLTKFWEKEIEIVRRAMGFRKGAHVTFDQMSLSDESSEKNLLIQLADRDIISHETILERFKEIPQVEKMRLKREGKARDNENLPEKAGPFHPPPKPEELKQEEDNKKNNVDPSGGRPPFKKDEEPRKQRVETPKSTPGLAEYIIWANETFDSISNPNGITKGYLAMKSKKNMRQLTKAESLELERLKLSVFTNIEPMSNATNDAIGKALSSNKTIPTDFNNILNNQQISPKYLSMDTYKSKVIATYVQYLHSKK